MIPSIGRIVAYTLTVDDADRINRRRADARASEIAEQHSGAIAHVGNRAEAGDVYPLVITRVWAPPGGWTVEQRNAIDACPEPGWHKTHRYCAICPWAESPPSGATEATLVNGQVMLDGNDTLWVTSVNQGESKGTWRESPRV